MGRKLHKVIPNSTFDSVPDAGHLAQLENPEFVQAKVYDFLSQ